MQGGGDQQRILYCFVLHWVVYTNTWQYNATLGWTHGTYEIDMTCIHFISPPTAENRSI